MLSFAGMAQNEVKYDTVYSHDGVYRTHGYLLNDKRSGIWICENNETNELEQKLYYYDSSRVQVMSYDDDLNLTAMYNAIVDDSGFIIKDGLSIVYNDSAAMVVSNFVKGKLNGLYLIYFPDNKLKQLCHYKDNFHHGKFQEFYTNGNIQIEGTYDWGCKTGQWSMFYENGEKKESGTYVQIRATPDNMWAYGVKSCSTDFFPIKDGCWTYWNDDGTWKKKEVYEYGKLVETILTD
jgi:hypothetical protein